jgi:murein DD-endopeptidase MepM/ murein hydrolase activator NlpD
LLEQNFMLTGSRRLLKGALSLWLFAAGAMAPAQTHVRRSQPAPKAGSSQGGSSQGSGAQGANADAASGDANGGNGAQGEAAMPSSFKNVFWQPNALQRGSVTFFTVEMARPASRVTGKFLGKEVAFFKGDKPTVWHALAGVDLETAPGTYDLAISAVVPAHGLVRAVKKIEVGSDEFKEGTVEVPENFVNPNDVEKKQIAADNALKSRAYAHVIPTPQWSRDFRKPVDAPSTPSFGMTRVLNEELTSQHRGTDFPAKEGSVVSASNAGTVVLAKEMFYEGNCVIVDHGMRFFTIYMHLSKMNVKAGDRVKKGVVLGLSGATGRVTGPHLHMGVRWNGAYIDPTKLLALTLPETGAETKGTHSTHRISTTRRRRQR